MQLWEVCFLFGLELLWEAETDGILTFYLDTLLRPLVSQQEPASEMGGTGEAAEETSGQICE